MNIILKKSANQPLYEQISSQIKKEILDGKVKTGEALPSIRTLAKELKISVITTSRAYEELEKERFIETVSGKGCFVAQINKEIIREENFKKIQNYLLLACEKAKNANISYDEMTEMLKVIYRS